MINSERIDRTSKALPWLLGLYGLTSLVHFMHNAEYLSRYPNLPAWLSRSQIYSAWCGITVLGVVGYGLYRQGRVFSGLSLLVLYVSLGFDGLLHYQRASPAAHTAVMNLTIWSEVAAAALALMAVVTVAHARMRHDAGSRQRET